MWKWTNMKNNNVSQKIVKQMAGSDSVLAEIITQSMKFKNSTNLIPNIKSGISFYAVGRNSSHEFYLGRKDGETWRMSAGESLKNDAEGFPLTDRHISKIEGNNFGYCGHY
ncbi:MAG: hypothetical protein ACOYLO_00165 [Ferruginibacter sp.]